MLIRNSYDLNTRYDIFAPMDTAVSPDILTKANAWLSEEYDEATRNEVQALIDEGGDELINAFYKDLEFGTGGMRGVMGAGPNKMNKYTIGAATQGLANYMIATFGDSGLKAAIAHDCRHNSRFFAETVAQVLSANGITVYLFDDLRPTPELSFAVRQLGCQAGIVLTASHNPPEYNGYKVYWDDGGQIVAPHDAGIIGEVRKIAQVAQINYNGKDELIHEIGEDMDRAFIDAICENTFVKGPKDIGIVYTAIHGTGYKMVPRALKAAGFTNVWTVAEQDEPDGDFPTVESPNPEEPAALKMGIEKAKEVGADIILGTDPDSDRVGFAVRDANGEFVLVSGNQGGTLMLQYLMKQFKDQNELTGNEFVCSTIVTTPIIPKIAAELGFKCYETLTGFKHIAAKIRELEGREHFVGGCEESFGYMTNGFVRDKDGVSGVVMFCELANVAKEQGKTLLDLLSDTYAQYGLYGDRLISVVKKGRSGAEEIAAMMDGYRNNPPAEIAGSAVEKVIDYNTGDTGLPASNVLQFFLADGSRVTARPSGTEPKIKFYMSVQASSQSAADERIDAIVADMGL